MRWIFAKRFNDGVVIRNIDDLHFLDPKAHDLAHGRERQRLKRAGNGDFAIANFGGQDFGGEFLFVEFLAQLQVLDAIEKFDDFLIGAVTKRAQKSRSQKFPPAFAAVEIDVKQIGGIELDFDPRTPIGNDPEAVKHFAVEMDR